MSRRRLPLLAEHSLSSVLSSRIDLSRDFDQKVRDQAREDKTPISCRVGCASCCYHPVHVTILEGILVYRHLVSKGRWTPSFKAKIEEHANSTRDLSYEIWLLSLIPCPLLDEGTKKCTVYSDRPMQCRATYSLGDPQLCHPHQISATGIVNRTEVMNEFFTRVKRIIQRHGLTMINMPLSVALLIGERIISGEFDFDGADFAVLKDYIEKT